MSNKLERIEKRTNITKNVIQILFSIIFIVIILLISPNLIKIFLRLDEDYIADKVTIAGVTYTKIKELEKIDELLLDSTTQFGSEEVQVTTSKQIVAEAKEKILNELKENKKETFWIFICKIDEKRDFFLTYFDISKLPNIGDTIKSKTTIYKRISSPSKNFKGQWIKGEIIGVLQKNADIQVLEYEKIEKNNGEVEYWALAK